MTVTTADLIHETRRHLMGSSREPLNKLDGAVSSGANTWAFNYDTSDISHGDLLCCGLEIVYVWDIDHPTRTATVERGQQGSDAAAQVDGAVVAVNPRFSDFAIFEALQQELRDLSGSGLYQMKSKTLTTSATSYVYDLSAADVLDVWDVRYDQTGPENRYPRLPYRWMYGTPTAEIPNGPALFLDQTVEPGRRLQVWYKAPFAELTGLTDNVATVTGLPTTALDIPPLGAAARLLGMRESQRVQIEGQPETRRSADVPQGATARAGQNLYAYRARRVAAEATRLSGQYPNLKRA